MKMVVLRRCAIGLLLLLVAAVLGLGLFLARGKELGPRHEPFDEPPFDYSSGSFADYIRHSQQVLEAARLDDPDEEMLGHLSPFMLEPAPECKDPVSGRYERGILLTHGLIASPDSMKPLGEFFRDECFLVLGLLLPDHGTRPGDMLDSDWDKWAEAHHFGTEYLKRHAGQVFLSGHSAGATLAIYEAAVNEGVDGLILFAPAMKVNGAARYAGMLSLLGYIFPGAAWFEVEPDQAAYRYESFPLSAAYQTWALIRETESALAENPLDIPVFMVASMEDNTVDTQVLLDFMARQQHENSFTLLYSRNEIESPERTRVFLSARDEEGILSVSHLGLMTPPDHFFYGMEGSYRYCGQYFLSTAMALYERCLQGEREFYGEITSDLLQLGLVERIAFNPFYDELLEEISHFLNRLE